LRSHCKRALAFGWLAYARSSSSVTRASPVISMLGLVLLCDSVVFASFGFCGFCILHSPFARFARFAALSARFWACASRSVRASLVLLCFLWCLCVSVVFGFSIFCQCTAQFLGSRKGGGRSGIAAKTLRRFWAAEKCHFCQSTAQFLDGRKGQKSGNSANAQRTFRPPKRATSAKALRSFWAAEKTA
jgi:hypothetical protein